MNRQETIKILSLLKAAYPNSYKGLSKEEANGTVFVWSNQFSNISATVVLIAVNKLIATSTFPPSISEVKEKIRSMYWEALGQIPYQNGGIYITNTEEIPPERLATLQQIVNDAGKLRQQESNETSLGELLTGCEKYLNGESVKKLDKGI